MSLIQSFIASEDFSFSWPDLIEYLYHDTNIITIQRKEYEEMSVYIKSTHVYNDRALKVIWSDGVETTVVLGEGDVFDIEKAFGLAVAKRFSGSFDNIVKILQNAEYHNCKTPRYDHLTSKQQANKAKKEARLAKKAKKEAALVASASKKPVVKKPVSKRVKK